ncbi:MAG: transporter substrate-binding domain-containing protein, partial [Treponema sp.]|nr:transporter substrate-binding domain-containing protein [Treponema sp.]
MPVKFLFLLFSTINLLAAFAGCAPKSGTGNPEYPIYTSYRDIPGVTEQEIDAIEALRKNRNSFVYGMEQSTECFLREDGSSGGYAALLCEYFSRLFGIPFVPELYEWGELLEGLADHRVDFSGDLTPTPERLTSYRMTGPTAVRMVKSMRIAGSKSLSEIAELRPPRYIFLEGTTTYTLVTDLLEGDFEVILADDYDTVYRMLKSGNADAFFDEGPFEAAFDDYGDVAANNFFPPIYSPVSLCTQNPALEPVISVVQKALENGALRYFGELYNQGYRDYLKHKFWMGLTAEERRYIQNRIASGGTVPVGLEYDNYPMCFFNPRDKEFQGITVDVLREIEDLSGLRFAMLRPGLIHWTEMLDMLDRGEIALVSELIPTPDREGRYLWPKISYLTDHYALLSRSDYKDITVNEILYSKIGLVQDTGYTILFHEWFPNHAYTVMYSDNL